MARLRLCSQSAALADQYLHIALEARGGLDPVEKHWRLNERHYGGLTVFDKANRGEHGDEAG